MVLNDGYVRIGSKWWEADQFLQAMIMALSGRTHWLGGERFAPTPLGVGIGAYLHLKGELPHSVVRGLFEAGVVPAEPKVLFGYQYIYNMGGQRPLTKDMT